MALAAAVRAEPARWRDVRTVAHLWARGFARRHPQRARRLDVLARYPQSLLLGRCSSPPSSGAGQCYCAPEPPADQAAACLLHKPSPASRPLLLLAMLAAVVAVGGLDVAMGLIGPMALAFTVTLLLLVGHAPIRGAIRTLRGRRQAVSHPPADIEIANVAAHPRDGTLGTKLMDGLIAILDSGHLAAQLDARSTRVAAWYADLGFLSAPGYSHSLHMYRPPVGTTAQPPATAARAARAPASSRPSPGSLRRGQDHRPSVAMRAPVTRTGSVPYPERCPRQ